jgi:hypothetical protein
VTSDQEQREAAPWPDEAPGWPGWPYPPREQRVGLAYPPQQGRQYTPLHAPPNAPPAPRSARRHVHPGIVGLLVVVVLLGGIVLLTSGGSLRLLRPAAGSDVADHDSYEFMLTQPGTDEPIGYDPCQVIRIAVNPKGAPANFSQLVDTAMRHTSKVTGLHFQRIANTHDREFRFRRGRDPVLVAWANAAEDPDLFGEVAGFGGSIPRYQHGRLEYTSGSVMLDTDYFDDLEPDDEAFAQALVDHEFGHLVGLDHVQDRGELMYPTIVRTTYGPGDLEGLARLGDIPCH